jgi:AraC-like DNA-binding protein
MSDLLEQLTKNLISDSERRANDIGRRKAMKHLLIQAKLTIKDISMLMGKSLRHTHKLFNGSRRINYELACQLKEIFEQRINEDDID